MCLEKNTKVTFTGRGILNLLLKKILRRRCQYDPQEGVFSDQNP